LLIFSTSIYSQKIFEDTKDSALLQRQRDTLTYEVNVLNKPTYLIGRTICDVEAYKNKDDTSYKNTVLLPDDYGVYIYGSEGTYYLCTYFGKKFFISRSNLKCNRDISELMDTCSSVYKDYFFNKAIVNSLNSLVEHNNKISKFIKSHRIYFTKAYCYDMSEYTDGKGYKIDIANNYNKTIKYVTISFRGYNAVNDPVGPSVTRKCIGPIEKDEISSYTFEYVWFTNIVEYTKITYVKVQFMDNSIIILKNPNSYKMPFELRQDEDLINEMEIFDDIIDYKDEAND
jgi:hypothetical protein